MKKIITLILIILLIGIIIGLSGCNKQIFDFNYKFDYAHIDGQCYKIKSWRDYDGEQLQIILEDDTVLLISSFNCTLIKGDCPFHNYTP